MLANVKTFRNKIIMIIQIVLLLYENCTCLIAKLFLNTESQDKLIGLFDIYNIKKKYKMKDNLFDNNNIKPDHISKINSEFSDQQNRYQKNIKTVEEEKYDLYKNKLLEIKDFNEAFELVKKAVDSRFNMHRAGLSLILQTMPIQLGAYHILGSNMIIMNKAILEIIKSRKSALDYNSYLFVVLCHEYLHSFGITDESKVRVMTLEVCKFVLGNEHPSTLMARYQPWDIFPELKMNKSTKFDNRFEVISKFDTTSQSYIN